MNGGRSRVTIVLGALLCAGAIAAIVKVGSGGSSFFDGGAQAMAIAVASVLFVSTAMAGVALAKNRPELAWLGYLTTTVSALAVAGIALAIWGDPHDGTQRVIATTALLALAGAHASLLLGLRSGNDDSNATLLRNLTLGLLALLVAVLLYAIFSKGDGLNGREVAVIAILYALGAALLTLFRPTDTAPPTAPTAISPQALEQLRQSGFEPVGDPTGGPGSPGPGHSIHLRAPDGSLLELIARRG